MDSSVGVVVVMKLKFNKPSPRVQHFRAGSYGLCAFVVASLRFRCRTNDKLILINSGELVYFTNKGKCIVINALEHTRK